MRGHGRRPVEGEFGRGAGEEGKGDGSGKKVICMWKRVRERAIERERRDS